MKGGTVVSNISTGYMLVLHNFDFANSFLRKIQTKTLKMFLRKIDFPRKTGRK